MDVKIRKAKRHDVHTLARNCREIDARECMALFMMSPFDAVMQSLESSVRSYSVFYGGKLASVYGVVPSSVLTNDGIIWMVSTKMIDDHPLPAVRTFKKELERVCEGFDYVFNYISVENVGMLKLLRSLGFKTEEPVKMGPAGKQFIKFHRGDLCA